MELDDLLNLDRGSLPDSNSNSEVDLPPGVLSSEDDQSASDLEKTQDSPTAIGLRDPPDPRNPQSRDCRRLPAALLCDRDDEDQNDRPQRHPHIDITEMIRSKGADDVNPANSGFIDGHIPMQFESGLLAGRSYPTWAAFDQVLDQLDYIRAIDPAVYARYAFPTPRWGHTTSNVVEILNGAIRPFRKKPALQICQSLWDYTMTNHFERLQTAKKWPSGEFALTQHAQSMLNILYAKAGGVEERPSSETSSLMCDSQGEWAIDMDLQICECKDSQEMGFPCMHAVKFCVNRDKDEKKYIHSIWMAANQVEAYQRPLAPIFLDSLVISKHCPCREPIVVPSKSKIARSNKWKASRFEKVIAAERLAAKQQQKCTLCRKEGHNKCSCPVCVQRAEVRMLKDTDYLRVCAIHTMSRDDIGQRWTFWNSRPHPKLSFS